VLFTLGSFAVGFAAFNTGNNLLYLLFGAMLGLMLLSGWLSEQAIRRIAVSRRVPRGVTVGNPARIQYEIQNKKRWLPSLALEVGEPGLPGRGFVPVVPPRGNADAHSLNRFIRRGVFPLEAVRVSTGFPFGLFEKSRDIPLHAELVVWPRSNRKVRKPRSGGVGAPRTGAVALGSAGLRGEYRGLRSYRPGDDPRDIHWRTSARLGHPVVREYEQRSAESLWICLDIRGHPGESAEAAVEIAASLAAQAFQDGRRFGLTTPNQLVEPGLGPGQFENILGALARVDFRPDAPMPVPPVSSAQCVLVTLRQGGDPGFGDVFRPPPGPLP